jgi:hypothetical protein
VLSSAHDGWRWNARRSTQRPRTRLTGMRRTSRSPCGVVVVTRRKYTPRGAVRRRNVICSADERTRARRRKLVVRRPRFVRNRSTVVFVPGPPRSTRRSRPAGRTRSRLSTDRLAQRSIEPAPSATPRVTSTVSRFEPEDFTSSLKTALTR